MKLLLLLLISTTSLMAQNLSPAEQKKLLEEVKVLREKVRQLEAPASNENKEETNQMMKTLQRGQKYQEDQLKALEELDKED